MRAVLIGSSGLVLGREYPLDAPVVTIGRRDENMIVIKDPTVSRRHAEIRREGEALVISDKGSTSGITVNGQLISGPQTLRDGDRIGIGSSAVFLIQVQPVEDETISFQQHYVESGRTQFITRELGDPRATPAAEQAADNRRLGETIVQRPQQFPADAPANPRPTPAAPPPPASSFAPPRQDFAPPPATDPAPPAGSFSPPSRAEPPRAEPRVPDFTPPRSNVDLAGPPLASPTLPDTPRPNPEISPPPGFGPPPIDLNPPGMGQGMGQSPLPPTDFAPRYDAPPPPGGGMVTEFAPAPSNHPSDAMVGGQATQFAPPPSFGPPPGPGNMPGPMMAPPGPGPMMAPPGPPSATPARGGRAGLVAALIIVVILVLVALVVVALLLTGRLG